MTPDHEYRVYRYKLAMDLLDGLENPNGMVVLGTELGPGVTVEEEAFKPEYVEARRRYALDMLLELGLTERRARDIFGLTDYRLLREMSGRDLREADQDRRRQMRGRPHPGRPIRSSDQVAADMLALVEMDDPAPVARRTPSQSLTDLLSAVRNTPRQASTRPAEPDWGDSVLPAQRRLMEPRYNEHGDVHDDPPATPAMPSVPDFGVDRFGVEYELPRKAKKTKSRKTKDGHDYVPPHDKPPPKPQRRLVVKRNRPPVAPDD